MNTNMSIIFVADCQLNTYICGREKHHYDNRFVHISGKEVELSRLFFLLYSAPSIIYSKNYYICVESKF